MIPVEIAQSFAALETGLGENADKAIVNLVMLVILAFPLAFTSILMRIMGGLSAQLGGMVNNRSKGIFDRVRNAGGNLSKKQTGAWKRGVGGYVDRGLRGYAAKSFDGNRTGVRKARNIPAMIAARQAGFTQRQAIQMGASNEAFEDAEVGLAMKDIEGKGYEGRKELLERYVNENQGNDSAVYAGMLKLAEAGGDKELARFFNSGDLKTKTMAAKAISNPKSKLKDSAAPLFFEAAGFVGEYNVAKGQGASEQDIMTRATANGEKVRSIKVNEQLSENYLMNLKPTQITGKSYDAATGTSTTLRPEYGIEGIIKTLDASAAPGGPGGGEKVADIIAKIHGNKRLHERITAEQKIAFNEILDAHYNSRPGVSTPLKFT